MVQQAKVDFYNPDTFEGGPPFDIFKELRENEPVYWNPQDDGTGFWVITRYDDVVETSLDHESYLSGHGVFIDDSVGGSELMLVNMDPPKHSGLRNLVSTGFTPKMIRRMEPHVRDIAAAIIDNVVKKGECDFVTDVAVELPLQVIAELIGIPQEDRHQIFQWSNQMIAVGDPEYSPTMDVATKAAAEIFAYCSKLTADKREDPKDDLLTVLLNAEVDGEKLEDMELNMFFLLLAVAGNETTRNLIGGGMLAFFENPDQWQRLKDDSSLMSTAVEEMLRWVSPIMYFRRTASKDTEIHGQKIKEGDKVTLWYGSANRDPDTFEDPNKFDVGREPNAHVALGAGG
ncbi:MAG: cytochrome P450, partial [Chloroflexi bacterium]|nr:cytochrome P450 [Chloroflexota bacterium]